MGDQKKSRQGAGRPTLVNNRSGGGPSKGIYWISGRGFFAILALSGVLGVRLGQAHKAQPYNTQSYEVHFCETLPWKVHSYKT